MCVCLYVWTFVHTCVHVYMCPSVSGSIYVSEPVSVCAWCVWGTVCEWPVYRQLQCSGLLWWDMSEEMVLYLPWPHEHRAGSL